MDTNEARVQALADINAIKKEYNELLKNLKADSETAKCEYEAAKCKLEETTRNGRIQLASVQNKQNALEADLASKGFVLDKVSLFMSLPPEIRNMIYRFALVQPHKGYLKLYYDVHVNCESELYIPKSLPLQLFQVCRQVNNEASSLFYTENVFAIADQLRAVRAVSRNYYRNTRRVVDVSRIKKLHITVRECRWLSSPGRSSPGVFREASKHHISVFAKAIHDKHGQFELQYLLIDCISGFYASNRMVTNLLKPLYMEVATAKLIGLTKVHIVSTDPDHYRYIRYLEGCMTDRSLLPFGIEQVSWDAFQTTYDVNGEDPENAKAGNELAAFFKVDPCYPTPDTGGA